MGEDENRPKGAADWKAPKIGGEHNEENDGISDPAQFFEVPTDPNYKPLDDDDQTPVVKVVRTGKAADGELGAAKVQQRLRETEVASANLRHAHYEAQQEAMDKGEKELIFRAVAEGDEDAIKSLLTRDLGFTKFKNLADFERLVTELLGGENAMSGMLDMKKLQEGIPTLAEIMIEMRVEIGSARPIVEITLVNQVGYGRRSGENVTVVSKVQIKDDLTPPPVPKPKKKSLWASATTLVNMVRGKGDSEN